MEEALERRTLSAEDEHWWYRGRRAIVLDAVARSLSPGPPARMLDAGCGGGATLAELARFGEAIGLEPSELSRRKARERGVEVVNGTLERLPFEDGRFDLGLLLDVLEHLDDDVAGLAELRRTVRAEGALIVTVPAHPRLWSRHDDLNRHRRRYTHASLRAAAQASGWRIVRLTHFNTLLLPAAIATRPFDRGDGLGIPPWPVNRALEGALQLERLLIRGGIPLPAGLSLLAELRR